MTAKTKSPKKAAPRLTVPEAFRRWQAGEPLSALARQCGRTLRGPFRKLAGTPAALKALKAARKAQQKKNGGKRA